MEGGVHLTSAELEEVKRVIEQCLPLSATVWVFGSRASGRATRSSDLDLALDIGRPVSLEERADLEEAFSESLLPMRVDLVDLATVDAAFAQRIYQTRKRLTP